MRVSRHKLNLVMSTCHECNMLVHCLSGRQTSLYSNAVDNWQQFLHQQHLSIILHVGFSPMFNENEVYTIPLRCCERDVMDGLAESGMRAHEMATTDIAFLGCDHYTYQGPDSQTIL